MFGIIKLTIHTITGMWVSIVLFNEAAHDKRENVSR